MEPNHLSSGGIGNKPGSENAYWRKWYWVVFAFLVFQIGLYYFITQYFKG